MAMSYNALDTGRPTSIDSKYKNIEEYSRHMLRKAHIETSTKPIYYPLADRVTVPFNQGTTFSTMTYVPLLDDRNVNDQGIDATGAHIRNGNLYGSSRDIGKILSNLPVLTEAGGRVNRVGFRRIEQKTSIAQFGAFTEITEADLKFDTEVELDAKISREFMVGIKQIIDDIIQLDLIYAAGVVVYAGNALKDSDMTGDGANPNVVTYETLEKLDQILTENNAEKSIGYNLGSSNVGTTPVSDRRVLIVSTDLKKVLQRVQDPFGNPAFIPWQAYGAAEGRKRLHGECGSIQNFVVVETTRAMHLAGAGAEVKDAKLKYAASVNRDDHKLRYDIHLGLCVAEHAFSVLNFNYTTKRKNSEGKMESVQQFNMAVYSIMPGKDAVSHADPFGKQGLQSASFYYGCLITHPEWIGLIKSVVTK